jgi:hypothetical protein
MQITYTPNSDFTGLNDAYVAEAAKLNITVQFCVIIVSSKIKQPNMGD